jgi:uncharacterized protein YaeQ
MPLLKPGKYRINTSLASGCRNQHKVINLTCALHILAGSTKKLTILRLLAYINSGTYYDERDGRIFVANSFM